MQMVGNILELSKTIVVTEMVYTYGQMEKNTMVNGKMELEMVKEFIHMMMEVNVWEHGSMMINMVNSNIPIVRE